MPLEISQAQWPSSEHGWREGLSMTGHLVDIVAPLISRILGTSGDNPNEPFRTTGTVEWYVTQQDAAQPRIFVQNTGQNEVALTFTGANQISRTSESYLIALGPKNSAAPTGTTQQDITEIIGYLSESAITRPSVAMICPTRDRTGVTLLNSRLVSTVIDDVLFDHTVSIPGQLTLTLTREGPTGYALILESRTAKPQNLEFTIAMGAQTITGTAPHTVPIGTPIPIPTALILPSIADSITLYYELPLNVYEQESRKSRSRRPVGQLIMA